MSNAMEDTGTFRMNFTTGEDRRAQIRRFLRDGWANWDGFTPEHAKPVGVLTRLLRADIKTRYRDDTFVVLRTDNAYGRPDTWNVGIRAGDMAVTVSHPWAELVAAGRGRRGLDAAVEVAFVIESAWMAVRDRAAHLAG